MALGLGAVSAEAVDEIYRRAKSDGLEILSDKPIGMHYARAVTLVAPCSRSISLARNQAGTSFNGTRKHLTPFFDGIINADDVQPRHPRHRHVGRRS